MKNTGKRVVIVGGGMAGLTAAAYLTKENFDVLLLEKNDKVGGLVSTFKRDGFSFDAGPRAFVNSGMVKPILKDLDIDLETVDNTISIAVEDQMVRVDSMDALNQYKKMLIGLYPENKDDIEKIVKQIYKLSDYTKTLYEFDNPYFVDYTKDKKFLITKFLPWTFKLLIALRKFKKFAMPMESYLETLTKNKSLMDILTQFFFRQTPTYFALGYFYVWLDYFYPLGGIGTLPGVVKEKVIECGGNIQYDTMINQVIPAESKVIDTKGNVYEYDHLVWAADLKTLYKQLDKKNLPDKVLKEINLQGQKVSMAKTAESSFIMSLAVNRPPSYFESRGGAHSFYTASNHGLGQVVRQRRQELIENFDTISKAEVLAWLDDFCAYNTYEVSIPVLRDSSLAPEGQTGVMISCLFDYELMSLIQEAGWADEFKGEMEKRIIGVFSRSYYKDLEKDLMFSFSTTPMTINKLVASSGGAIVGWSFETQAPVYSQLGDMPKCARTPIPNVYQSGQWAYAPAGVPIAMLTGWHASQEIIKSQKK